jgi:hypothetical protein
MAMADVPPVPIHTYLVWNSAGDPQLLALLAPRCALGSCNRILRGAIVTYKGEMFHEGCWSARTAGRLDVEP